MAAIPVRKYDKASVLTSANRTGAPTAPVLDLQGTGATNLSIHVNVTAVGASPSLAVNVKWSTDGTTFFATETADAFTALTATGSVCKTFTVRGLFAQINTTPSVGGITYTVDAFSH